MIDFGKIKNKVKKQQSIILSRIRRLKRDDPFSTVDRSIIVEPGTDAAALFGHEQVVVLENQLKRELKETEAALAKIKKGTYGICERCGKRIDPKRLEVKPQAVYCLKCKNELEAKKN